MRDLGLGETVNQRIVASVDGSELAVVEGIRRSHCKTVPVKARSVSR
jgi:hypothetical protein